MGPNFSALILLFVGIIACLGNAQTTLFHTVLTPGDLDLSIKFYVDGIGLSILENVTETANYKYLFGATTDTVSEVYLGNASLPATQNGVLELTYFEGIKKGRPASVGQPETGFFVISFFVDVNATLARLEALGLGGTPKIATDGGVQFGVVRDPDGVQVLLLEQV
ncbi:hypothetical protein F5884DRAFT_246241 [Xylogone sp. PMI_703]|nr:hypothetical protein F5884DRAFT_246241 [Xylogone sp. PMI_703]